MNDNKLARWRGLEWTLLQSFILEVDAWCNIYNVIVNFILGKPVYKWDTCTAKTEEKKEFKDVNA